jgi:peptidoglycan/xylan/chitin deacetylase (PgdA/CDA1 family)
VVQQRSINITFHGIGRPPRPLESGESGVWVTRAQYLSMLDSVAGRDDVRITFDDGNASDVEQALEPLRARGLTATFFVVAGRLGEPAFLDESGVRELAAAGMEIGSHGMRHRPWRGLGDDDLREELVEAKQVLEAVIDRPITQAACPFGAYDRRVLRTLRRAGYHGVYTSDRGTARPGDWLQARTSIGPHDGPSVLDRIGAADTLQRRVKRAVKRWR